MAVQAQYPSNVLLLNRSNNIQEAGKNNQIGIDYSLQAQPGEGASGKFLDQSHILFNNFPVGNNPRKRGREITTTSTPMDSLISMQPQAQPPQLIDLTQLHTPPQQNVVSTGLRLAFGDHQQQFRQQHQQSPTPQSSVGLSLLSAQIKQHREETDQFLQTQEEHLRRTLAEKSQQHCRALLCAAEESVARILREKEAEVEKAVRRNAELEARAAQLANEAQVWQARARAQEVTAATLQAKLQQAIMSGGCAQQQEREEGVLTGEGQGPEDAESAYIDPDRFAALSGPSCKTCRNRVASVVLLPCRHLCVCTECDGVVQACPVCLSFRSSSVEVFLS